MFSFEQHKHFKMKLSTITKPSITFKKQLDFVCVIIQPDCLLQVILSGRRKILYLLHPMFQGAFLRRLKESYCVFTKQKQYRYRDLNQALQLFSALQGICIITLCVRGVCFLMVFGLAVSTSACKSKCGVDIHNTQVRQTCPINCWELHIHSERLWVLFVLFLRALPLIKAYISSSTRRQDLGWYLIRQHNSKQGGLHRRQSKVCCSNVSE